MITQAPRKLANWPAPISSALSVLLLGPQVAGAADEPKYDEAKQYGAVSVHDRDRSAWRPDGVRIGNFIVTSELGYNLSFNDNVFGNPLKKVGDFRHELNGQIRVDSHLPRHLFDVIVGGRFVNYQDNDRIRWGDAFAVARFRIDIDRHNKIFGEGLTEITHEDHLDLEQPAAARETVPIQHNRVETGYLRDAGRLAWSTGVRFENWNYRDVEAFNGSNIDQDFRDLSRLSPFTKLSYKPSPGYRIFGELYGHFQRSTSADTVPSHDGRGVEARAGVEFELSPLVKVALTAGYWTMDFETPALQRVSTPIGEATIQWLVTPLLTLSAKAERYVAPTFYGAASAAVTNRYVVAADYELLRNLVISARGEYRQADYAGATRVDDLWIAGVTAEYMHTKNWMFTLSYEYRRRASNETDLDVEQSRIMAGVKYRY
jgi:hypothetical protein